MTEAFLVTFQTEPPRPSWTAFRRRTAGVLWVESDHARFVPRKGEPIVIEHVFQVSQGWRQSTYGKELLPIVDTFIEVLYGDQSNPKVAFINDNRLSGLASLKNPKLLKALSSLVRQT